MAALRVRRFLDPLERSMEVLFGLIMVLVFTGSISVAEAGGEDVGVVLAGAIGCNLAWAIVDAAMYLLGVFAERARGLTVLRAIRQATTPGAARVLIAGVIPPGLADLLGAPEFEALRLRLAAATDPRVGLGYDDYMAAGGVFLLVFLSTFPVVVPFLLMADAASALRVSQAVALVILFLAGRSLGLHAGRPGWRTGLAMVLVGVLLSAITFALGG